MKRTVVDASMAGAWTLEDERTPNGDQILEFVERGFLITTTVFWHEYRNILAINQRRGRVNEERLADLLELALNLGIQEIKQDNHDQILGLAFAHTLSAYDAAYRTLAIEMDAGLATNDRRLARAALSEGVEVHTTLANVKS